MKAVRTENGFTLVEVLVAMAILAVVLLGTAAMLGSTLFSSRTAHARVLATAIANGRLERLGKIPFSSLSSHAAPPVTEMKPGSGTAFSSTWTVAAGTGVSSITVTTAWTDNVGRHTVSISGARSR